MPPYEHRKIGIIGPGRLGSSLAAKLDEKQTLVAISSRNPDRRDSLRERFPNATILDDYTRIPELADTIFITTSDAAIKEVCDNTKWQPHHWVIHCSGSLTVDVLASAKNSDASTAGFHPLQTFPYHDAGWLFEGASFAIDSQDEDLKIWLETLVADLNGASFPIQGETAHAAYHASAVLACGLLAGLVGVSAELWQTADIDRDRALKLLSPILNSTIEAITTNGLPDAISGPYVRGDIQTIQTHLETTKDINPDISRAYAALALAQLPIANEKGNLDPTTIDQIRKTLTDHLETL